MAGKLNARKVETLSEPGRYGDGNGLMLVVRPTGAKSWLQRVTINGKRRDIGVGSFPEVSLAEARTMAQDFKRTIAAGGDPLAEKQAAAEQARLEEQAKLTWNQACHEVHRLNADSWKNAKHTQQFINTLTAYTAAFADTPVAEVTQQQILKALTDIWLTKPETARRVAQRIKKVLMWARAQGAYQGSPHDTMEAVKAALPSQKIVSKVRHHPAMPHGEVRAFLDTLQATDARPETKLGLEFLILTAARSGEMRMAQWSEVDLAAKLWTIPEERMKMDRAHVVPLSDRACEILQEVQIYTDGSPLIFPGARRARPMSDMTTRQLMKRLGSAYVPHGFRSTFRDWCNEVARAPREVAEMCLAHHIGSAVERAYSRSDMIERRRELMDQWGRYVAPVACDNVVAIHG
ncbi:site-specific integrase [Aliiroseovarius crassostreae]|uniref:tyrosine-type recombinase/integrase n=1 Tax=Aliiroseovarius crassostreae TaxID=154981 RepID=UPI0021AE417C|nr:site-specific integrase [Aliiroseovarius crassostreae]UWQ05944.1 tyrosine-type recombinase/integrase [Aliiroseovarius crassostreae]